MLFKFKKNKKKNRQYHCLTNRQLAIALQSMGVSPTGDMEMVQQIKDEVRRLCTRYNIAAKIAQNELEEDLDVQRERYFSESPRTPESKVGATFI